MLTSICANAGNQICAAKVFHPSLLRQPAKIRDGERRYDRFNLKRM